MHSVKHSMLEIFWLLRSRTNTISRPNLLDIVFTIALNQFACIHGFNLPAKLKLGPCLSSLNFSILISFTFVPSNLLYIYWLLVVELFSMTLEGFLSFFLSIILIYITYQTTIMLPFSPSLQWTHRKQPLWKQNPLPCKLIALRAQVLCP